MLNKTIFIFFLLFLHFVVNAQDSSTNSKTIDSLKYVLATAKDDSTKMNALGRLGFNYQVLNIDSALKYTDAGISLAKQKGDFRNEANLLATLSGIMSQQGKFAEALDLLFRSLKIAEDNDLTYEIARAYRRLGGVYFDLENYSKAISYGLIALKIDEEKKYKSAATDHISLANAYDKMGKIDSALVHANIAISQSDNVKGIIQTAYRIAGDIQIKKSNFQQADSLLHKGLALSQANSDFLTCSEIYSSIASMFLKLNEKDSAHLYALKGFEYGKKVSYKKGIMLSASLLAELHESTEPAVALKYYKIVAAEKDSLFGVANIQTIQNLITHEEKKQQELEDNRVSYRNSLKLYSLLTGIVSLLVIAFILYRNIKQKQKANVLLQHQKEKVETTLTELKSAQAQLIQSEKMASLGELTAGIAHEIQNPLNFVNNFSDVNKELLAEMKDEMDKGNIADAKEIANDIIANEEKINHHGKRADAIVKGMLQHSQSSSGLKEPTDINKLADEYLRLAYHGIRAKEKSFNATLKTDFGESIGKINIIPQDIGRVLLNLYNNAFYAVGEKKKQTGDNYDPTVSVSTKRIADKVLITVRDNGNGIPQKLVDKIFQPFFTTKPTGQGTGLGLSLAYDIVKSHGGELKVETEEGEGTEFIIQLPII
jgi:two-component system, NtrC family, sensor kinase